MAGRPGWGRIPRPLLERLWERVQGPWEAGVGVDDCWLWAGLWRSRFGHGRVAAGGKQSAGLVAHRLVYEQFWGPLLPSEVCRHTCDVPLCVNPYHLVAGTPGDNIRDQYEHGFYAKQGREDPVEV